MTSPTFPLVRPRRLRRTEHLRGLVRETTLSAHDLIYPIFVEEGIEEPQPIASMPDVMRIPEASLGREVEKMARDGVRASA